VKKDFIKSLYMEETVLGSGVFTRVGSLYWNWETRGLTLAEAYSYVVTTDIVEEYTK
jgi:hypothetical protein